MQLVLDDQLRGARAGAGAEEGARALLPCDARELVDGADQERRRLLVEGLVHHVAGQRTRIGAEFALGIDAMEMEFLLGRMVSVRCVERRAAPRAAFQKQLVARLGPACPDLLDELLRAVEPVGADRAPDPDADVDRGVTQSLRVPPANQLQGADHARRPFELLPGEQAQRVAHECRGACARAGVFQTAPDDQERDQTQVRLGLATAGGKPDEVQNVAKLVILADRGHHDGEQKRQLKGTPTVVLRLGFTAGDTVGPAHLVEHRPIGQPERLRREPVVAQRLHARPHAVEGDVHPVADPVRRSLLRAARNPGGDALLLRHPARVAADESVEFVEHGRLGETREVENRIVAADVHGHHRDFGVGHELGPDPRRVARPHVPVGGRSVTDGIDALFPVLKLQLLLLFGEQAGIDPGVVDELSALDDTLEPGLEQRFAHSIAGSLACRGVRVQLAPVAQGDGEDAAVSMRPRTNVDSRTSSPKRLVGLARNGGSRPGDRGFREFGPGVLPSLKSSPLASFFGASIYGSGGRDGKSHVPANVAGESDRRRRHVPAPARRSRERRDIGFRARVRRVFVFVGLVVQVRFRFVTDRRCGIDAGSVGFDRMQHPGRVSVQGGHPHGALTGRTDELATQPSDKLLPGLDVHHFPLQAVGRVSQRNGGPRRPRARPTAGIASPRQFKARMRHSRTPTSGSRDRKMVERPPVSIDADSMPSLERTSGSLFESLSSATLDVIAIADQP